MEFMRELLQINQKPVMEQKEQRKNLAAVRKAYEARISKAWGADPDEDAIEGMADMLVDFSTKGPRNESEANKIDAMIDQMIKDHKAAGKGKARK